MDYKQREHATRILKLQAEILSELEGMISELDAGAEVGRDQLIKVQKDYVFLQTRFSRLVYLSGEVTGE